MLQPQNTTALDGAASLRFATALAALVLGAVAMGASPLFVRLADVGPYASAFWRVFLALPFLAAWAMREGQSVVGVFRRADKAAIWSGIFFAGDLFFWHLSILATTVANATFFATTAPIWVAFGAWLVLSEVIGGRILSGLALCILGGAALVGQSYGYAADRLLGDFYGIVTAVFFGCYLLAIRAARVRLPAGALAFVSTAITAAILFVVAVALEPTLLPASIGGAAALLALAIISQVGGQGLLAIALGTLPATFSSLVIFLEAVAAAAFAWLFLGEALGTLQVCGGVLILIGIYIARPRAARTIPAGP
jgi:drug/metabolite transporter (DMT)-like permease